MIVKKKKEPGSRCCVAGCKNTSLNSPGTTFYVFSQVIHKKPQTDRWIRAVQQNDPDGSTWQPKKFSRICSRHFIGNKKSAHPYNPSFVPTIFPEVDHNARRTKHSAKSSGTSIKRKSDEASEQTSCVPASQEPIRNNGEDNEIIMQHEQEERPTISQKHQETQVQFSDTANDYEVFICNRYVNNSISDAETQVCILPIDCNVELIRAKKTTKDRGFGTRLTCVDVAAGPDSAPLDNSSMKCASRFSGFSSITNNKEMLDLAGVTLDTFDLLLKILEGSKTLEISQENRLLIFLVKMKLGLPFSALSVLFKIHRKTITRAFYCTLSFLSRACKNFVLWPSKEVVQATMPTSFNETYKNCRVVIDCTEIKVEQPRNLEQRVQLYSHHKKAPTVKTLVGCTPSGFISFISKCYGGRTTCSQITTNSGFLELLEPGDIVLANTDFAELKTSLNAVGKGNQLVIPPFLHKKHFSAAEVAEIDGDASVQTHIERIMRRIKSHGVLNKFSVEMLPHADDVLFMCCVLANLQPPIVRHIDN